METAEYIFSDDDRDTLLSEVIDKFKDADLQRISYNTINIKNMEHDDYCTLYSFGNHVDLGDNEGYLEIDVDAVVQKKKFRPKKVYYEIDITFADYRLFKFIITKEELEVFDDIIKDKRLKYTEYLRSKLFTKFSRNKTINGML